MSNDFAATVNGLSVKFDDFYAVKNISFSVNRGEIFGFLGANGAGKTTTVRVLCGLIHPTVGEVTVGGIKFDSLTDEMLIKKKVGYMSQRFTLYNDLTVEENFSFIASIRKLDVKTYFERRDFILKFISFQRPLNSFVKELPGGIKQQVSLAAAILHDPEIIFLDEPTSGVTPASRAHFWALIRDLASKGKTVFVTTHYMDEAEQCERIALMNLGEVVALDTPNNLKKIVFPSPLYELNAKKVISYKNMENLRRNPEFEYFEPYGIRFHVVFRKTPTAEKLKNELKLDFEVKEISPTLEDVFIKKVEGKT